MATQSFSETAEIGVAAIVLAAGRARRFGATETDSKVLADLAGLPLVRRVALSALASGAAPVLVVTGHAADAVSAALAEVPVRIVHNPNHASGIASSLQAGLAALPPGVEGALILLGDMPLVTQETMTCLIVRFAQEPDAIDAVIPIFEGRQGNPVLIGRGMFAAIATLSGDQGARKLLARPGRAVVYCDVDDRGVEIDVDTREALNALRDGR